MYRKGSAADGAAGFGAGAFAAAAGGFLGAAAARTAGFETCSKGSGPHIGTSEIFLRTAGLLTLVGGGREAGGGGLGGGADSVSIGKGLTLGLCIQS